jgi:hypothetical protein
LYTLLITNPDISSYLYIHGSIIETNSPNRHRITIQTQTDIDVSDDKNTDLEYGSNPPNAKVHNDKDIYQMRGPKVLLQEDPKDVI